MDSALAGPTEVHHFRFHPGRRSDSLWSIQVLRSQGAGSVFRLALPDQEAVTRTAGYLADLGICCIPATFTPEPASSKRMTAIRTACREEVRTIEGLIGWPEHPSVNPCPTPPAGGVRRTCTSRCGAASGSRAS